MTNTAFGPQGINATTTLPTANTNVYGLATDTWVKDCTSAALNDGTVLNAQFFNNILGNLRYACQTAGVTLTDGDMTMLYKAITAICAANALVGATNGLKVVGSIVEPQLGSAAMPLLT